MGILEIVLLAAGALIFIASFSIPVKQEKLKDESKTVAIKEIRKLVSGELENVRGKLAELSEEEIQEQVKKSERSMERISNEKIMAVGEYSDTVLNEIHKNHEEVVFLYDMLNKKKESLSESYGKTDQNLQDLLQQVKDSEITVREYMELISNKQKEIETRQAKMASYIAATQKAIVAQQEKAAAQIAATQKELEAQQEKVAEDIAAAQQEIEALQTKAASHIEDKQKEIEAQQGEVALRIEKKQKEIEAQQGETVLRIAEAQKELEAQQGEAVLRIEKKQKEIEAKQGDAVLQIEAKQKELEMRQAQQKAFDRQPLLEEAPISPFAQEEEENEVIFRPFTPEKIEAVPKKKTVRKTVKKQPEMLEDEMETVKKQLEAAEDEMKAAKRQLESADSFAVENTDMMIWLSDSMEKKAVNSNERILELHKAGKSNMAIARELGLGLGEVKLVIDLYKGSW